MGWKSGREVPLLWRQEFQRCQPIDLIAREVNAPLGRSQCLRVQNVRKHWIGVGASFFAGLDVLSLGFSRDLLRRWHQSEAAQPALRQRSRTSRLAP